MPCVLFNHFFWVVVNAFYAPPHARALLARKCQIASQCEIGGREKKINRIEPFERENSKCINSIMQLDLDQKTPMQLSIYMIPIRN